MKHFILSTVLLSTLFFFASCDKTEDNDPKTKEKTEAEKKFDALQEEVDANFEKLVSNRWVIDTFVPSKAFTTASSGTDDAVAVTRKRKADIAPDLKMIGSFEKDGDQYKIVVSINIPEADIKEKLQAYQDAIAGFQYEVSPESYNTYFADLRRVLAAPFAADDLEIDDITCFNNGLVILKIEKAVLPTVYDDAVLAKKKLIKGNTDNIFFDADGKLNVEVTTEKYGVLVWKYRKATNADGTGAGVGIDPKADNCADFQYNPIVTKLKGANKTGKFTVKTATKDGTDIKAKYTGEAATNATITISGSNAYGLYFGIVRTTTETVIDNGMSKEKKVSNRKDVAFPTGSAKFTSSTSLKFGEQVVTIGFSGTDPVITVTKAGLTPATDNGTYVFTLMEVKDR